MKSPKSLLRTGLICIGLTICLIGSAQDFSLEITKTNASGVSSGDGQITVTVVNGTPNYSYYLFHAADGVQGKPIYSLEETGSNVHSFVNLNLGEYLIVVNDKNDIPKAVKEIIE